MERVAAHRPRAGLAPWKGFIVIAIKVMPRSLLAALSALCLMLLQAPIDGSGSASVGLAAAASGPAPRTIINGSVSANGVTLSPIALPIGAPLSLQDTQAGAVAPASVVTATLLDAGGAASSPFTATASVTGAFALAPTVPLTFAAGLASVTVVSPTGTLVAPGRLPFIVNAPTASLSTVSGTHCTTTTLALDNFAPGLALTPTLVYSNATGAVTTSALGVVTPSATGLLPQGVPLAIPTDAAYNSTATISLTAAYPVTPAGGFPTFALKPAPAFAIAPPALGPLGVAYTVSLSSTGAGAFNIPAGTTITFTIGLQGQTLSPIVPTSIMTSSATGTFTATLQFTPTVAGSYVIRAGDANLCNVVPPVAPAATPTSTPPPPPTSTATPIPPTSTPVPPTATPTPRPRPALAFNTKHLGVTSGGTLSIRVQSSPRATIKMTLSVTATRIKTTGKGAHRKRVKHTVVLYRVTYHGKADRHGRLTGRLHVTYKTARGVQARLTVTARTATGAVTRTATVTIRPRHR